MNLQITKLPLEILGEIIDRIGYIHHLIQLRLTSKWMLQIVDSFVPDFQLIPAVLRSTDHRDKALAIKILKRFYGIHRKRYDSDTKLHLHPSERLKALSSLASRSKRAHKLEFDAFAPNMVVSRLQNLEYCPFKLYYDLPFEEEMVNEYIHELVTLMTQPTGNMVALELSISPTRTNNLVMPSVAEALQNPDCKLVRLWVTECRIGDEGFANIAGSGT